MNSIYAKTYLIFRSIKLVERYWLLIGHFYLNRIERGRKEIQFYHQTELVNIDHVGTKIRRGGQKRFLGKKRTLVIVKLLKSSTISVHRLVKPFGGRAT